MLCAVETQLESRDKRVNDSDQKHTLAENTDDFLHWSLDRWLWAPENTFLFLIMALVKTNE